MKIQAIDNNEFNIQMTLLNKCNYSCRYCPPKLNSGSTPLISTETYLRFFKDLLIDNPEIMQYEKRFAGFTGGEPSLHPGIEAIIDFFRDNDFNVSFDTNGSAKMDFWERNLSKINMTNLSVHLRYANFKHLLNIVKLGVEKQAVVKVAILMDPEYWDRAHEVIAFFKENNVPIMEYKSLIFRNDNDAASRKQGQTPGNFLAAYTDKQLEWIKNNPPYYNNLALTKVNPNYQTRNAHIVYEDGTREKFLGQHVQSQELNKFSGFKCLAGRDCISIRWDGSVRGAHCGIKDIGFGSLVLNPDLRIKLAQKPVTCTLAKCSCISDMRIRKWKE